MFRFTVIGTDDYREIFVVDSFHYDGKSLALYVKNDEDSEIIKLESSTLVAAFWNIQGFEVEEYDRKEI